MMHATSDVVLLCVLSKDDNDMPRPTRSVYVSSPRADGMPRVRWTDRVMSKGYYYMPHAASLNC